VCLGPRKPKGKRRDLNGEHSSSGEKGGGGAANQRKTSRAWEQGLKNIVVIDLHLNVEGGVEDRTPRRGKKNGKGSLFPSLGTG